MPGPILILIAACCVMFAILFLSEDCSWAGAILLLAALSLFVWMFASAFVNESRSVSLYRVGTVELPDGTSYQTVKTNDENVDLVNVTKELGLTLPDGSMVRRVEHGTYLGIDWGMSGRSSYSAVRGEEVK